VLFFAAAYFANDEHKPDSPKNDSKPDSQSPSKNSGEREVTVPDSPSPTDSVSNSTSDTDSNQLGETSTHSNEELSEKSISTSKNNESIKSYETESDNTNSSDKPNPKYNRPFHTVIDVKSLSRKKVSWQPGVRRGYNPRFLRFIN